MAKQSDGQSFAELAQVAGNELGTYSTQAKSLRKLPRSQAVDADFNLVMDEEGMAYYQFYNGADDGQAVANSTIDPKDWK